MPQLPMYQGVVNSPQTELAAPIDATQDTIPLLDASVLPPAPNLATLGTGEDAETVLYTGINGNTLTGVTRGFQGTARAWAAGTKVARYYTAYDHEAFMRNIEEHETRIGQNTVAVQQVAAALDEHKNESVLLGNTPHGIVYEEGTFTPYFRPLIGEFQNIEYNEQYGYYVRRDNLVWVYGHLSVIGDTLNVGTASGHLRIAGLPYICRASGVIYGYIGEGPRSFRWNVDEKVIGITYRSMPAMAEVGLYKKIRPGDNIVNPSPDEQINVVHLLKSSGTHLNIVSFSFHYLI